jgi:aryl-alcohol dehydrogenase-like predicted oxidoreductase
MAIERRPLGSTGLQVSVIGFGGAETGYGGVSPRKVAEIVGAALDQGLNFIDTAACYGDGEDQIGQAVAHRRGEFYLATKCGHSWSRIAGRDWTARLVAKSIERSLKRLRTDRIDLMQLHSCDAATIRDGRVVEVLKRARAAGKIRFLGYSGDGEDAVCAVESGEFDTLQISVSVADQEAIDLVLPGAVARGMGVIVKRPIANAAWRDSQQAADPYARPYYLRLQKLGYEFLKGNVKESIATALRFTLSAPGVSTAIVGTARPGRWQENAAIAQAGPLPRAQYDAIRSRWREVAPKSWTGQR